MAYRASSMLLLIGFQIVLRNAGTILFTSCMKELMTSNAKIAILLIRVFYTKLWTFITIAIEALFIEFLLLMSCSSLQKLKLQFRFRFENGWIRLQA